MYQSPSTPTRHCPTIIPMISRYSTAEIQLSLQILEGFFQQSGKAAAYKGVKLPMENKTYLRTPDELDFQPMGGAAYAHPSRPRPAPGRTMFLK